MCSKHVVAFDGVDAEQLATGVYSAVVIEITNQKAVTARGPACASSNAVVVVIK